MNSEPTLLQLKQAFLVLLDKIDTLHILLDGVDECNPRDDLLQLIPELITDPSFEKVHILATSRQYSDIERVLKPISQPISMSNPLVDEDIKIFVVSELKNNPKFRRWRDSLIAEITETLVSRAKGM